MTRTYMLTAVALGVLGWASYAPAQYYPPPYTVPPGGSYYPAQPGGFMTGNPSPMPVAPVPAPYPGPYYDPNARVAGNASSSMSWDPNRGWVTNTQQTGVLNSALSPGRAPMPGTAVQTYNYWNGTQWVQGTRWLGQDGLWHGTNTDTMVNPTGGTSSNTTVYAYPGSTAGKPGTRPDR